MLMILPLSVSLCWPVKGVKRLVSYHNVCAGRNSRNQPADCGLTVWITPPSFVSVLRSFSPSLTHVTPFHTVLTPFYLFPSFNLPCQFSVFSHFHCLRVSIIFIFCVWLFLFQAHVSSLHPQVGSTTSSMGSIPSGSLFSSFLHHTHPPHHPPPPLSLHSPASTPCL